MHLSFHLKGGSGGAGGLDPPFVPRYVGFLILGPKLDPRLAPPFSLADLIWTPPPFQKSWIRPCICSYYLNITLRPKFDAFPTFFSPRYPLVITQIVPKFVKNRSRSQLGRRKGATGAIPPLQNWGWGSKVSFVSPPPHFSP